MKKCISYTKKFDCHAYVRFPDGAFCLKHNKCMLRGRLVECKQRYDIIDKDMAKVFDDACVERNIPGER